MQDHPPRVVYDDVCGFCTWCAEFAARHGDVEPVGFSELSADQLARLPDDYEDCAHLLTDDAVYSCGEVGPRRAVTLARSPTSTPVPVAPLTPVRRR
jgi:hypothetical protein